MFNLRFAAVAVVALAASLAATPAYAHGFGERYDLPIPLDYFIVGAAAAVVLSFVVIGLFVHGGGESFDYPRHNLRGDRLLSPILRSKVLLFAIRAVAVAVFALVLATSLFGSDKPIDNLSPTFIWVIWWVGVGYLSALVGNVWMLVNPWKILFEWVSRLAGGGSRDEESPLFKYPEGLDVWPAVFLFFAFAWTENVYSGAYQPQRLGLLILLYSFVTWTGMAAFGKRKWLARGEAFSVLFGLFAKFSVTEVRVSDDRFCRRCSLDCNVTSKGCVDCYECFEMADEAKREFNLRPVAVGLARPGRTSIGMTAFVVLALATVTFDGVQETPMWLDLQSSAVSAVSFLGSYAIDVVDTLGLVVVPTGFLAGFFMFSWGIKRLSGEMSAVVDVANGFVFALVPIALAYNLAHFISFLAIQGQLMIPLASDPFGFGWDMFGTADYLINIGIVNAKFIWFLSVVAIVAGHIVSVYISHIVSLFRVEDQRKALQGQYPMLALMVLYTATSLWLIAQPIVG